MDSSSGLCLQNYCSACEGIFECSFNDGQRQAHHQNSDYLRQSATNGCQFCSFIWELLTNAERERMRRHAERPLKSYLAKGSVHSDPTTYHTISRKDSGYLIKYEFLSERYRDDHYAIIRDIMMLPEPSKLLSNPEAPLATDVSSAVALASWWLECCQSHDTCLELRKGKTFLPTRLINVGNSGSTSVSLYITDEFPEEDTDTRYMALSHCWGSLKIMTLQTRGLKAMQQGIELSCLSKTFNDAVQITRALGVRYIWIDSLCIIQDDPDDWFRESARMMDVYTNSYLTIAATAAEDGNQGLLFPRNMTTARSSLVRAAWSGFEAETYCLVDTDMWASEVDQAPLNQRAWVFQERFLSPRTLGFGAKQLFWECSGMRASETFPGGLPPYIRSVDFKVSNPDALNKLYPILTKQKKQGEKPVDVAALKLWFLKITGAQMNPPRAGCFANENHGLPNAYRQWVTIVEHYSKGLLTKESDRLIALYGVAQWMKEKLIDDQYVAGHWKRHLLNQLLWMTYPNLDKQRPTVYRAPSWSWASVIGKIAFRDILEAEGQDKVCQLLDVEVTNVDGKEGQITGGYIRIKSQVFEGTWRPWNVFKSSTSKSPQLEPLWDNKWSANPTPNFEFKTEEKSSSPSGLTGFPDVETEGFESGQTTCVVIQQSTKPAEGADPDPYLSTIEGLVLKRDGLETFKRIGCFTANGDKVKYVLKNCEERVVKIV
ncbi:heterokaryon incompatibility protein-domain-containing protein [Xylariaceae sp. AK1471]|nr:heterokaryon incompatibility protein-domain-containing protein [Xylariaceae sp. AK1471]